MTYTLENGVVMNLMHPDTFEIPSKEERHNLAVGDNVKLIFKDTSSIPSERMWVEVTGKIDEETYIGFLNNDPVVLTQLEYLDPIRFRAEHVVSIIPLSLQ